MAACAASAISSATVLSVLFGLPLAWILARVRFPGRALVRGLVLLPLVLPPVVGVDNARGEAAIAETRAPADMHA